MQKSYLKKYVWKLPKFGLGRHRPTDSKSLAKLKQDKLKEIRAYIDYDQHGEN